MLHTHLANRPEALVAALAALQRVDPLPLLETETVVVPSTAVARCLQFRLADALGIATRIEFAFPAAYVWELFGRVLSDIAEVNPFDRALLKWRLLRLLETSRFDAVQHFLAGDDGARGFELAGQLASLFDRYLVERPDWIAAWSNSVQLGLGADETWQAALWQALLAESPPVAREHPRERFLRTLRTQPDLRIRLPRRLSLFCVEAMPLLYWEVFAELTEWIDLHVFVLTPTREYWGDIELLRRRLRLDIEQPEAACLFDTGHPLLASLGRARQFATGRLADVATRAATVEHTYFAEPPATLLGGLQRDLLQLLPSEGHALDASLQIHDCHGAQREAEVLLDRLIECFEALPDLHPTDILILTPDIERYGPIIAAVLANAPRDRRIACAVADQPLTPLTVWRALRQLCVVASGELDAESVMALLDEPLVRRAFAIAADELPCLRNWVAAAGIRWGVDAASRQRQKGRDLRLGDAHGWRAGLRRLLLGMALPDAPERLWQGMLPLPGIEGERAVLLGRFLDFTEALFALSEKLGAGKTAPEWTELLTECVERWLAPDETEEIQVQRLRATLEQLGALAQATQCAVRLPLRAVLRELDEHLAEPGAAHAFVSGGAAIAALKPGRPVAARIVCLVGMNDGAWPRPAATVAFDLMAAHPRTGDRSPRDEARYAFLEAVLCAGDALIVTYTGRDVRSNLALPPAAPLAELLDTLTAMTGLSAVEIVLRHPLQPFGNEYFSGQDERLFSFDAEQCPSSATGIAPPFDSADYAFPAADEVAIDRDELQGFFVHPPRYFLRERLGISLTASEERLPTQEPFMPSRLEAYRLRQAQFEALTRDGMDEALAMEADMVLHARGWLPQGVAGKLVARAARAEARGLWEATQPWRAAKARPDCRVEIKLAAVRLRGRLGGLSDQGLLQVRHGRLRARDRLQLWLDHLVLNTAAPSGVPCVSTLIATDGRLCFGPEPAAAELLADLLVLYREGVSRCLPFFPETAWAWLTQKDWRRAWEGDRYNNRPGERDDPYTRLALRDKADDGDVPPGAHFRQLAARVFAPLRSNSGDD